MLKATAKMRLDPVIERAAMAVSALSVTGSAIEEELERVRSEVRRQLSWFWVAEDRVALLQARGEQVILAANEIRGVLQARAAAQGVVEGLRGGLVPCGPEVRATITQRANAWAGTLERLGMDAHRLVDARNDLSIAKQVGACASTTRDGVQKIVSAHRLLQDLRGMSDGMLPLVGAELDGCLPDLEREFAMIVPSPDGKIEAWIERLDVIMSKPQHAHDHPPQAPEALISARSCYERLARWRTSLGGTALYRDEMDQLEAALIEVEANWQSAGGEPEAVLRRIENMLSVVENDARAKRDDLRGRLETHVRLVHIARFDVGGLDDVVDRLRQITVRASEHHERWEREHKAALRGLEDALKGAAASGDMRDYLTSAVKEARARIALVRVDVLADSVAEQLAELERDLNDVRPDQSTVDGWLQALGTAVEAVGRVERAELAQKLAVEDHRRRLNALALDLNALTRLSTIAGVHVAVSVNDLAACETSLGELRMDPAFARLAATEQLLLAGVGPVDRALRFSAEATLTSIRHQDGEIVRLGAAPSDILPELPSEWRRWADFLETIKDCRDRVGIRHARVVADRRAAALQLVSRLEATRGVVMPIEDREPLDRAIARLGLVAREEAPDAGELIEALAAARGLADQLTEAEDRLSAWHRDLGKRLDTLRVEGFREWNPEIAHRASALVKGIGVSPPVAWSEVEGQLKMAEALLSRLEVEGRRRAAAEVVSNVAALNRAQRTAQDAGVAALLHQLGTADPCQLPPRSLRTLLRAAAKRL